MKGLSVNDERRVADFLKSMRFRDHRSATVYRCALRGFLRYVRARKCVNRMVSGQTMRAWLRDRRGRGPEYVIVLRAQLIARFLSWMRQRGHIANNPFDALRSRYGGRIAPIVRALLSTDSAAALEKLRPLPAFASAWGQPIRERGCTRGTRIDSDMWIEPTGMDLSARRAARPAAVLESTTDQGSWRAGADGSADRLPVCRQHRTLAQRGYTHTRGNRSSISR